MPGTFRRSFSRAQFGSSLLAAALTKILARIGRRHLRAGLPQLVVFAFDHVGQEVSINGRYESYQLETIGGWLRDNGYAAGTAVDVGANIGNHSLFFAQLFDHVHAFEPSPRIFELLRINARLAANVTIHNVGLSDRARDAELQHVLGDFGSSRVGAGASSGRAESIRLTQLDQVAALAGARVRLIKIDVEGHELEVLKGARLVLDRDHPVVVFEAHAETFAGGTSAVIELLRTHGYERFAAIRNFPRAPEWLPSWLRVPLTVTARFAWGFGFALVETATFAAGNYSMIVAIPPTPTPAPPSSAP